ncbi:MAG: tRNA (adenosine(37)-N6)-dimethylallyltransferase MiaA [candidate division Zixibacteria bacterium]|nr:tRNA (adenosine(37)-N6)-dimethylallyltransferase MiaA [candidate division Zixibacteria bacterium]
MLKKILTILGPTASGKTKVSLEIADIIKGEIVSADSRQIYRFMDIGTAKPGLEERKNIPHHLIDIVNPDEYFSAADYSTRAREAIKNILGRGKEPIVVGGSGLYLRALFKGIFKGPGKDEKIRSELKEKARKDGVEFLFNELEKKDPEAAKKIGPHNLVRIIRALEVYELTGKKISDLQKKGEYPPEEHNFVKIGLELDREHLYQRIDQRVEQMIKAGLVDEVKNLKVEGYDLRFAPLKTFGYKEIFHYLDGKISLDEAVQNIKLETRHYAKRQITWFKKEEGIFWIYAEKENLRDEILRIFAGAG